MSIVNSLTKHPTIQVEYFLFPCWSLQGFKEFRSAHELHDHYFITYKCSLLMHQNKFLKISLMSSVVENIYFLHVGPANEKKNVKKQKKKIKQTKTKCDNGKLRSHWIEWLRSHWFGWFHLGTQQRISVFDKQQVSNMLLSVTTAHTPLWLAVMLCSCQITRWLHCTLTCLLLLSRMWRTKQTSITGGGWGPVWTRQNHPN